MLTKASQAPTWQDLSPIFTFYLECVWRRQPHTWWRWIQHLHLVNRLLSTLSVGLLVASAAGPGEAARSC